MTAPDSTSHELPPTPAFVFDVPVLDTLIDDFQTALDDHWPGSIFSYSVKTNSLPWLLNHMREKGIWAEVVSDTEYELALAIGFEPDKVVYNGPIKSPERVRSALLEGSIVNLDSNRDLRYVSDVAAEFPEREFKVGLRVNWDLEKHCPGQSNVGQDGSWFGFNEETGELDRAFEVLAKANVTVAGLHMHRNSLTQSLDVFRASAKLAAQIVAKHNLELEWIDMGGGFFGGIDGSPTFADYVSAIREELEPVVDPNKTSLIVEPGGAVIAVPVEFHAGVLDVKRTTKATYIVSNASRTNIDPMFQRVRPYKVEIDAESTETVPRQIISGFTCMETDRLMELEDYTALREGDRIVFKKVGAYTMSHQPMFIEYLPEVYIRDESGYSRVREKWGVEEYLQKNKWDASVHA